MRFKVEEKLKPEEKTALRKLYIALQTIPHQESAHITSQVWVVDQLSIFSAPLLTRQIPSGTDWRWNQTKARKLIEVEELGASITATKLLSRKTSADAISPNYKLWRLAVSFHDRTKKPIVVLWCERGRQEAPQEISDVVSSSPLPLLPPIKAAPRPTDLSYICN